MDRRSWLRTDAVLSHGAESGLVTSYSNLKLGKMFRGYQG